MECPDCGSGTVTLEVGPEWPISTSVHRAALDGAEGDRIEIHRHCWTCGWREDRHLRLEAIEPTHGDAEVIDRRRLIEEIESEATALEGLESLAAIRRL